MFFQFQAQDDSNKKPLTKAEGFSLLAPSSTSRSSANAVNGLFMEESTQSSSEAHSISSVEFAGMFVLPNGSYYDNYDTNWTFVTSNDRSTPSTSCFQPNLSSARCQDRLSSNVEVGVGSDLGLKSESTIFYLKDMPSSLMEENPLIDNNMKFNTAYSTTADSGLSTADQHNL